MQMGQVGWSGPATAQGVSSGVQCGACLVEQRKMERCTPTFFVFTVEAAGEDLHVG